MESLKRITRQRQENLDAEPLAGINWMVCLMDVNALLSGSGTGDFVSVAMKENMIPHAEELRKAPSFLSTDPIESWEWDLMAPTFDFLREITMHAAKIGQVSRQIREAIKEDTEPPNRVKIAQWTQQANRARELLKQSWNSQVPAPLAAALGQKRLVGKTRKAYEQVSFYISLIATVFAR